MQGLYHFKGGVPSPFKVIACTFKKVIKYFKHPACGVAPCIDLQKIIENVTDGNPG